MKYAVFSDVHGNYPALKAFLEASSFCDAFICLGDIVGYGPDSDLCLETVCSLSNVIILKGNHEENFKKKNASDCSSLAQEFFKCSFPLFTRFDLLPDNESACLGDFEFRHSVKKNGKWVYLYQSKTNCVIGNLCVGHTHYQNEYQNTDVHLVNVGSIGQNRANKSTICWAEFDSESNLFLLHENHYDLESFINRMKEKSYGDNLIQYYRRRGNDKNS